MEIPCARLSRPPDMNSRVLFDTELHFENAVWIAYGNKTASFIQRFLVK